MSVIKDDRGNTLNIVPNTIYSLSEALEVINELLSRVRELEEMAKPCG